VIPVIKIKELIAILFLTLVQNAWADEALEAVLDDLEGNRAYSTQSLTVQDCISTLEQNLRSLSRTYDRNREQYEESRTIDRSKKEKELRNLDKKQTALKELLTRLPGLAKSVLPVPQLTIFNKMSEKGRAKYSQGHRVEIPDLETGFDLFKMDLSSLNQADLATFKLLHDEVQDLLSKDKNPSPSYTIHHIKGISFNSDDVLNEILDKIDSLNTTEMDRETVRRHQLHILSDVQGRVASEDSGNHRGSSGILQQLKSDIEKAKSSTMSLNKLIQFLRTHDLQDGTKLDNEAAQEWESLKESFQPAKKTQLPALITIKNLSFEVTVGEKTQTLSTQNIGGRVKERERFYSQIAVYKGMSKTAAAEYRSGQRYTLDKDQLIQHLFDPLKQDGTDGQTRDALERLQDEIEETLKIDLHTKKVPPYTVTEMTDAHYDADQLKNMILAEIDAVPHRPADRQANLAIDLKIVDTYIQLLAKTDKARESLMALRAAIESGQGGSSRSNSTYNTYGNSSSPTLAKNQSREEWETIVRQLSPARPPQPAKMTNPGEITLKVSAAGKSYTVSLKTSGMVNYAQRRLSTTTKYSKEKSEILSHLIKTLKGAQCKSRDECRKTYGEEIKSLKNQFGKSGYNSYSNNSNRQGTQKAQEMDMAIQRMLDNFLTILTHAFDIDRPQTRFLIYEKLSEKGKQEYRSGVRLSDPKEARLFKEHPKAQQSSPSPKSKSDQSSDKGGMIQSMMSLVGSLFGGGTPAPAPAPVPQPKPKPQKPKAQPQRIDYAGVEQKLLKEAFFDTDDILLYIMQVLERTESGGRSYSDTVNNDTRAIEGIMKTLNQKDPVLGFLYEIIGELKDGLKQNPVDLDSLAKAFKKVNYTTKIKLESQDEKTWEAIESQKSKKRQSPVPPRIANANQLLQEYYRQTKPQKTEEDDEPSDSDFDPSALISGLTQNLTGAGIGGVAGAGGGAGPRGEKRGTRGSMGKGGNGSRGEDRMGRSVPSRQPPSSRRPSSYDG
jgi:hypothetical protein